MIEWRLAEGRPERAAEQAAELVRLNVDVILHEREPNALERGQVDGPQLRHARSSHARRATTATETPGTVTPARSKARCAIAVTVEPVIGP